MSGIRGVSGVQTAMLSILKASVDVYRKGVVPDSTGGVVDAYTFVDTLPCLYKLNQFTPRESETGVRVEDFVYLDFTFLADADIRPTDRLYLGTRRFEIVGGGTHSLGIFSQVTCLEIQ